MPQTKLRSSKQFLVDADFDINSKKLLNVLSGTANTDGVNKGQMDTAISNAVTGLGNSIHAPVADLAAAKAVASAGRADKMIMLIETLGLYRFDAESTATSNDNTVIRPTDVANDTLAGRWIKMSTVISDHNNLSNIQGGGTGDYQHLTTAQVTKLDGLVTNATHTGDVTGSTSLTIAAGAVTLAKMANLAANSLIGNNTGSAATPLALTAAQVRTLLNVADGANAYVHPNHSGDVTSVGDGATTIAAGAVTLAKMANLAANSLIGNNTASAATPLALTAAQVRTLLNVADGANNYVHPTGDGNQHVPANGTTNSGKVLTATGTAGTYNWSAIPTHTGDVTGDTALTIAAGAVTLAKMANLAANSLIGNNTGSAATPLALTTTQVRTLLNVADGANNYVHPNHSGDVTSVADGATTIAAGAVTLAKMANLAANSIIGNNTASSATPLALTAAQVRTLINVADGANNYVHPNHSGDVTSVADGATTIAAGAVTLAKMATLAANSIIGNNTGSAATPIALTVAQTRTMLGLNTSNLSSRTYRAPLVRVNSTSYTILITNFISGSEEVFRNGYLMSAGGDDYSASYVGGTLEIILVTGADTDEKLLINYSNS